MEIIEVQMHESATQRFTILMDDLTMEQAGLVLELIAQQPEFDLILAMQGLAGADILHRLECDRKAAKRLMKGDELDAF